MQLRIIFVVDQSKNDFFQQVDWSRLFSLFLALFQHKIFRRLRFEQWQFPWGPTGACESMLSSWLAVFVAVNSIARNSCKHPVLSRFK